MTRAGFARALVAALLLTCMPLHAQGPAPEVIRVGIVWWPADPADAMSGLGSDMDDCLTKRIREIAPEIVVVRQRAIRDALFPLLEPATQPATEVEFAALLAREEVHARLARHGLRYLIAFTGGTIKDKPGGFILCSLGCLGFSWQGERTALDAALWSLGDGTSVRRREGAKAEGAFVMPAYVFPVPIPARTEAKACHELGTRIALSIRQTVAERTRNR